MAKKQEYYKARQTILICEVKGSRNRPVNSTATDHRGDLKFDPCRATWAEAFRRQGLPWQDGLYAVLTSGNMAGSNYEVLSLQKLDMPMHEAKQLSHEIHRIQTGIKEGKLPETEFTEVAVMLDLLPNPNETHYHGALDTLIKKVAEGSITNQELIAALLDLRK